MKALLILVVDVVVFCVLFGFGGGVGVFLAPGERFDMVFGVLALLPAMLFMGWRAQMSRDRRVLAAMTPIIFAVFILLTDVYGLSSRYVLIAGVVIWLALMAASRWKKSRQCMPTSDRSPDESERLGQETIDE